MKVVDVKCPNCGGSIELEENEEFAFCRYCGTKVIREEPVAQKVKIENPIKIDGKVEIVNNDFESKLAKVHLLANKYFNDETFRKSGGYEVVIQAFNAAIEVGGQESRVYTELLDFDTKAFIEEIKSKRRFLIDKSIVLSDFDTKLQMAVYCEKDKDEKDKIKEKYGVIREQFVRDLNDIDKIETERRTNNLWKVAIISLALVIIPIIIVFLTCPV